MSEGGRLRALAMDELDLIRNREDGIPPVFGLLPKRFTIEQLQLAVRQAARLLPEDIQKSSNFRRRLVELTELGVLERTYDTAPTDARGRPPQFYRFNSERWIEWLQARRHEGGPGHGRGPASEAMADFMLRRPDSAQAADRRFAPAFRMAIRSSPERREPSQPTKGDDRVERLEEMMRTLMGELADLKRSAPKPEPPTEVD